MRQLLLSTAYFAPPVYFSLLAAYNIALIEKWENYLKQTYRNRCVILGANGPLTLSIPVLRGSFHKTPLREIEIDISRDWRKQHVRSITSAYAMAPYFEYYIDDIIAAINYDCTLLLDFNLNVTETIKDCIGIKTECNLTDSFSKETDMSDDFRYSITPKKKTTVKGYKEKEYTQVFSDRFGFTPGLSILDILFNNGPGTLAILHESLV